jgi:hypothetical protein
MPNVLILMPLVALASQAPGDSRATSYTPEPLAVGAIREIVSAQAVHKRMFPQVGYACSLERLVETQMLLDSWLAGKRVEGYIFKVWCDTKGKPQANYRASGVPSKRVTGATLTVCTDEANTPRTIDGDAAACFAKGVAAK